VDSAVALATITRPVPGSGPGSRGGTEPLGWRQVSGSLGLLDLDTPPAEMSGRLAALRIFIGYAGWGPGQLESEIAEDAWYVVAGEPWDAFTDAPGALWRVVLRRQRDQSLALVSTFPDDPTLN
jgi:putative transcriptional regulator